eukprot:8222477-Alexandrium_andersonii.AAC.1
MTLDVEVVESAAGEADAGPELACTRRKLWLDDVASMASAALVGIAPALVLEHEKQFVFGLALEFAYAGHLDWQGVNYVK